MNARPGSGVHRRGRKASPLQPLFDVGGDFRARDVFVQLEHAMGRKALAICATALALLLMATAALVLPAWRLRFDPDFAYRSAYEQVPSELASLAVQACENSRPKALAWLAARPAAGAALAGDEAEVFHARLLELAAREPAKLKPCVASLHAMGWNADRVAGNTVGALFGTEAGPAGYRSFLSANAGGLLDDARLDPRHLRAGALLFAVWYGDSALARELVRAGARPETPAIVDAFANGRPSAIPVLTSLQEARRLGDPALASALER